MQLKPAKDDHLIAPLGHVLGGAAIAGKNYPYTRLAESRRRAAVWLQFAVPALIYGTMSWIWFGDAAVNWRASLFAGKGNPGADPLAFVWFLNWWPWALRHGLNPVISHYVWAPAGDNLAWLTSVPLAALAAAPITWLAGPVLSYNILTLAAPVLAAYAAFLLARELTGAWPAALLGGYLFGFSSYEFGQMLGHLNLEMIFPVPLIVWLCVRRHRGGLTRNRFVAGIALLLLAQLGLSLECLATTGLLGAVSMVMFLAVAAARDRAALLQLGLEMALAAAMMVALASPYLVCLAAGWGDVPPAINPADFFSADPMNFLIPTAMTRLGRSVFAQYASGFTGGLCEQGGYLGLPLMFIAALFFWQEGRKPYVRGLLAVTLAVAVLSLGPRLHVGHVTAFALPWKLFMQLPLLGDVLPCRLAMFVSLAAAIAAACWLAGSKSVNGRIARYALAGIACLFLAPNSAAFGWTAWPRTPFFTPGHVTEALGPARNVLILPFGDTGPGLAWQVDAGMRFTQAAGYVGFVPMREAVWRVLADLEAGRPSPGFANDFTAFCVTHHVDDVLLGPGTPPALANAVAALGWPDRTDDGVRIIRVPATAAFHVISGDYWPSPAAANWMGRQITLTAIGEPVSFTLSGAWRPMASPVRISVTAGSGVSSVMISQTSRVTLHVPANASITLRTQSVFVPSQVWTTSRDDRPLSVLIGLGT